MCAAQRLRADDSALSALPMRPDHNFISGDRGATGNDHDAPGVASSVAHHHALVTPACVTRQRIGEPNVGAVDAIAGDVRRAPSLYAR